MPSTISSHLSLSLSIQWWPSHVSPTAVWWRDTTFNRRSSDEGCGACPLPLWGYWATWSSSFLEWKLHFVTAFFPASSNVLLITTSDTSYCCHRFSVFPLVLLTLNMRVQRGVLSVCPSCVSEEHSIWPYHKLHPCTDFNDTINLEHFPIHCFTSWGQVTTTQLTQSNFIPRCMEKCQG